MKVVWICSLSNQEIRNRLKTKHSIFEPFFRKVVKCDFEGVMDVGIWNINAINEIKKIPDIELHIVSTYRNLIANRQDFDIDGIHYHFIKDENSSLVRKVRRYLFERYSAKFMLNRKRICKLINEIKPDIVHMFGAENVWYSLALLDLPKNIPTILQLQALLVSIKDKVEGPLKKSYLYKGELEKQLICNADYIGTCMKSFIDFIRNNIKPDARILNTTLAMAQNIDISDNKKEFDFVHFAAKLNSGKASDVALDAFGLAHKSHPEITLDLIGSYDADFKAKLDKRISYWGIQGSVKFEGLLLSHDDVILQMRKARFALLPFKVSIVPNTLHEAMANGLPALTTVTPGTPKLNDKRLSVLISEPDDYGALAKNMIRLIEDCNLAENLRKNAAITEHECKNNHDIVAHWVEVYEAIIKNHIDGTPISSGYFCN